MRVAIRLIVPFCLFACWTAQGADPTPDEIKGLIDQLVSTNPEPPESKEPYWVGERFPLKFPKGFDPRRQLDMAKVIGQISGIGPSAFPYLIERFDDARYSITTESELSGSPYNWSVGTVCREIIQAQVQPCGSWCKCNDDPRGYPRRPNFFKNDFNSKMAATAWWNRNKEKTLQRIQLEALEWIIAEEAKYKPEKGTQGYPDVEKAHLQELRKEIDAGKVSRLSVGDYGAIAIMSPRNFPEAAWRVKDVK
jgi:hypothetical protein